MMPPAIRPAGFPAATVGMVLLIAVNLRGSLTSVGPLLETIQDALDLSATGAGLLSSLPLLTFAAISPLVTLGRRWSIETNLLAALLLLVVGILLRSLGPLAALFSGTFLLSAGLAIMNVLLPSLVRRDFPDRVGGLTTAYAMTMGGTAALASGLAVPLARLLPGGWQSSLAAWVLPAIVVVLLWIPRLPRAQPARLAEAPAGSPDPSVWRSALAWQVTAFMGLQSLAFYVAIGWFPQILREHGHSAEASGWLLTLYQGVSLLISVLLPALIKRFSDQRALACIIPLPAVIGTLGLAFAPGATLLWFILLGLSSGASLILALYFISARARHHHQATALSGMAQSAGYLIAAAGPVVFGGIHDLSGRWTGPLIGLAALGLLQSLVGLYAGRNRQIT